MDSVHKHPRLYATPNNEPQPKKLKFGRNSESLKWKVEHIYRHQFLNVSAFAVSKSHMIFTSESRAGGVRTATKHAKSFVHSPNDEPYNCVSNLIADEREKIYFVGLPFRVVSLDDKSNMLYSQDVLQHITSGFQFVLAIDENNILYVTEKPNIMHMLNKDTLKLIKTISEDSWHEAFVVHQNIKYGISETLNAIQSMDLATGKAKNMEICGNVPLEFQKCRTAITVDHKRKKLYVAVLQRKVVEISLTLPHRAKVVYDSPFTDVLYKGPSFLYFVDDKLFLLECTNEFSEAFFRCVVLSERIDWDIQ